MSSGQRGEQPPEAMSVSELTGHIKAVVEETFPPLWVVGEISDLTRPRSGHVYLTLKDDDSQIRGVIWRSTAARLNVDLHDGQAVLCFGELEVYAARGTYQLVIRKLQPQGLGALQIAFQKLQAKLNAEGLFAVERKRPLPRFPRRIAVVTSPSGAAVRDFLKAADNRWQGGQIVVVPALVQGEGASRSVELAIRDAHRLHPKPDVILLTRGGGSLEDLWCFNEERVVRAVAASKIPIVSAIGHEIDITLCDLAADVRALTPTDGATQILPDGNLVEKMNREMRRRLDRSIQMAMQDRRARLEALAERTVMRRPHEMVHLRWRRLDELDLRARRAMFAKLEMGRANLATAAAALSALSPLDVLTRGYSVTMDPNDQAITDARAVDVGDVLRTKLFRGEIESVVQRIDKPEQ